MEVEYDEKLFNARGGSSSVSIHPDGNVAWTVEVSDDWIIVWGDESGTGDVEIEYMVAAWNDEGSSRTGWIKIGDKKIYITQRAYDLSISPNGKKVTGNNGAGEIGVSASIGDVWNAIVTEPWITIVDGYDSGTGSGTVRFIYTENNTGKTRTGKIIIAGEVYTLEQAARMMVNITATAGRGGKVSGGGSYDLGSEVTLTAIPDDGYKFSYWTGAIDSMQNPIKVTVDVAKSYTAVFEPLPIAFDSVTSGTDGVRLSWNNLAWATTYRIYRGVTSVPSSATQLAEIVNTGNCTYLDESGVIETTYWYWIEAEGAEDSVMSDPMTGMKQKPIVISPITYQNLRGATHTNPNSYQEGSLVSFANPSGVTGYTFAGWTPSQITADTTGAQTVSASWTANRYTISYNANGGSGDNVTKSYTHGATLGELPTPTRDGYKFLGWFTAAEGGNAVTSETLVTADMTVYARWEPFDGHDKVQLWENGPYWATTNIGAEKPEDYGYYFWWGDTVGYKRENNKWVASDGSNSNFSFSSITTCNKNVAILQSEGWITPEGVLAPEHDAAHTHWGGDWRMPTKQEFDDLNNKCDWTWTTMNGVNGYMVRGKDDFASASVFLPCAGYCDETSLYNAGSFGLYWSSVPHSDDNYGAWYLFFNSGDHSKGCFSRFLGHSVRPLQGFTK